MELFEVVNNELRTIEPFVLGIPEFKAIWSKVMTTAGDADGRKKRLNTKVLLYVFYMADFRKKNPLSGVVSIEEKHERAIKLADLPPTWQPNEMVADAVLAYKDIMEGLSPSIKLLQAAKQGMSQTADQILVAVEQNEFILQQLKDATSKAFKNPDTASPEYGQQLQLLQSLSRFFADNIKELRATVKDMKPMKATLDDYESAVSDEAQKATKELFGGGTIHPRELPRKARKQL